MSSKIIDLNRHSPTVESVISRLDRHQQRIAHISGVVEYDDGTMQVFYDTKSPRDFSYEVSVMQHYLAQWISDGETDEDELGDE